METTKEQAIEIMRGRGYSHTASSGKGDILSFARDLNGIWLHADVDLPRGIISMTGGILKMSCVLSVGKFDFFHKEFERFEKWLYFYSKVCEQIDVEIEDLGFIRKKVEDANIFKITSEDPPPQPAKKETLEDRMNDFKKKVIETGKKKGYQPNMCKAFFNYWSETNDGGRKMRFEITKQKTGVFNIERRMITWAGKDEVYNSKFADRDEKKAKKQNEEVKKEVKTVSVKTLF